MLKYSQQYPHILEDWNSNISLYIDTNSSIVQKGLVYNETLLRYLNQSQRRMNTVLNMLLLDKTGSNRFLRQLSYIDRAAIAWVTVLKPLKLDIFYGFRTEKALMEYYTNSSKKQNLNKYVLSGKRLNCVID